MTEKISKDKLFIAGCIILFCCCVVSPLSVFIVDASTPRNYAYYEERDFSLDILVEWVWIPIYVIGLILIWFSKKKILAKIGYTLLSVFLTAASVYAGVMLVIATHGK
jgi:uncharacterized membrane protein